PSPLPRPQRSTLFPYTTLFRSSRKIASGQTKFASGWCGFFAGDRKGMHDSDRRGVVNHAIEIFWQTHPLAEPIDDQSFELGRRGDRKSTRLNSSHLGISYAVFC